MPLFASESLSFVHSNHNSTSFQNRPTCSFQVFYPTIYKFVFICFPRDKHWNHFLKRPISCIKIFDPKISIKSVGFNQTWIQKSLADRSSFPFLNRTHLFYPFLSAFLFASHSLECLMMNSPVSPSTQFSSIEFHRRLISFLWSFICLLIWLAPAILGRVARNQRLSAVLVQLPTCLLLVRLFHLNRPNRLFELFLKFDLFV